MLELEINEDEGIAIVRPSGPLRQQDFTGVAREIDACIERRGALRGLIIHAESFPGWEDFAAFSGHIKFVRDHHRHIERVAAVTDSGFLAIMPKIAAHFVAAEIKHFGYDEIDAARRWILEAGSAGGERLG